jgi:uncharacterized membrane protein YczE
MKKSVMHRETAYVLAMIILSCGTALVERANFGISMVVAPSYLLHLKISQSLPWFSFGVAEYTMQTVVLLVIVILMGRVKLAYLFAFVSAMLSGVLLDAAMAVLDFVPYDGVGARLVYYFLGIYIGTVGVGLILHSYVTPGAYESFVKELGPKYGFDLGKFKTAYDCGSLLLGLIFSFAFFGFGNFVGIRWGTVVCAVINGSLVAFNSRLVDKLFDFEDAIPKLGKFFREL